MLSMPGKKQKLHFHTDGQSLLRNQRTKKLKLKMRLTRLASMHLQKLKRR
jgi:hypothetical protein